MPVHLHGAYLCPFYSSLEDAATLKQVSFCSSPILPDMLFVNFWRGQCSVFSRDILKGGLGGVLSFGKYNTLLLLPI